LSLLATSTAQAQTISTDTIAPDSAHQPKWEAGVAGVAVTVPDYPASDQNRTHRIARAVFRLSRQHVPIRRRRLATAADPDAERRAEPQRRRRAEQ
jgi:hypothetical protein